MKAASAMTWRGRWQKWFDARSPRQDQLLLHQGNVYILPTRVGWAFAMVVLTILMASINEQVNLGYALSFLLGGAAMAAIYQTHGNLQGLRLQFTSVHSVHAGQSLRWELQIHNPHRSLDRLAVQIGEDPPSDLSGHPGKPPAFGQRAQFVDVPALASVPVQVDTQTVQRGWLPLPRLRVETQYPLGFFRAWAFWRPQSRVLVWPRLDPLAPPLPTSSDPRGAPRQRGTQQQDELAHSLRTYRRGDPMRLIAWKKSSQALSAEAGLFSREHGGSLAGSQLWLDYNAPDLAALDGEARLSRLCSWLLMAEQAAQVQDMDYGLRLPELELGCGRGSAHLRQCLDSLATWHGTTPATPPLPHRQP